MGYEEKEWDRRGRWQGGKVSSHPRFLVILGHPSVEEMEQKPTGTL